MSSFSFLHSSSPYAGRGSTNKVVEWFNLLVPETRGYMQEAGFEPISGLLPKKSASATLVQCLIERWWGTTHTFHIAKREMTMTPYDFYCMTGLSFEGAIIRLDDMSGIQLGLDMLGRKYSTETIHQFDLVSDYMFLLTRSTEECVRMARAFLLHLLQVYLFTNGWKMVSLRWLTLFQDFGETLRANWGQACLAYLYSTLDILSRGTLRLLVRPWKLFEVSYLFILCTFTHSLQPCKLYRLEIYHLTNGHLANETLQTFILPTVVSNLWLVLLLHQWVVRYGLITPGTNLVLREFPQVKAHLARLTSVEVSLRVLVVHASSCISFRILFF